jgi:predicted PurR-regulated permease PerM
MVSKRHQQYLFYGILLLLAVLCFLMIRDYVATLLGAALLSYLFYRPYEWLQRKVRKPGLAATIIILFIILIVALPAYLIGAVIYHEAQALIKTTELMSLPEDSQFNKILDLAARYPELDIRDAGQQIFPALRDFAWDILSQIPDIAIKLVIMLFVMFYMLIDGKVIVRELGQILSLKESHNEHVMKTMRDTVGAVIWGQLIAALAQGAVAAVGYWLIAGNPDPLLWGFITAIVSLLPVLGAALVWVPMAAFMIYQGIMDSANEPIIRGVILVIWGVLVVSTIDNLIKAKLISRQANVHQIIAFLGVFGGLSMFGLVGIFVGPVIFTLFVTFIRIYMSEHLDEA